MEIKNDLKSTGNSAGVRAEKTVAAETQMGFWGMCPYPAFPLGTLFQYLFPGWGALPMCKMGRGDMMEESIYIISQQLLHGFPPLQRTITLHGRAGEEAGMARHWYSRMNSTNNNLKQQFLFSITVCVGRWHMGSQQGRRGEQCTGMRPFRVSHRLTQKHHPMEGQ